jgi:2-haloacid dehalogenase
VYKSFGEITHSSLGHALAEHQLEISNEQANQLMMAYDTLQVFPEIPAALDILQEKRESVDAYIFSNGTADMLENSITRSPDLGPYASVFKRLVSVDHLRVFKPDKRVYEHLVREVGKQAGNANDVWLVSANPFDVVGAESAGLKASFIDRAGNGWVDRLDERRAPSIIARSVDDAIRSILG